MSHYFIENKALLTDERTLELDIFDTGFKFLTNNGLFSCDKIDDASVTMLKNLPPLSGTLLDLGCGYGVLGITLAKKYSLSLTMADVNGIALDYATRNAKINGVHSNAVLTNCFDNITDIYDNIVLNPPIHAGKDIMYRMYEEAARHLTHSGSLYIVIYKKHGAESTIIKLQEIYDNVNVLYKKKGCYVVQATYTANDLLKRESCYDE